MLARVSRSSGSVNVELSNPFPRLPPIHVNIDALIRLHPLFWVVCLLYLKVAALKRADAIVEKLILRRRPSNADPSLPLALTSEAIGEIVPAGSESDEQLCKVRHYSYPQNAGKTPAWLLRVVLPGNDAISWHTQDARTQF